MSIRLFHPELAGARLAVVAVQPPVDGRVHVAVARGPSRLSLTDHKLYGPFPAAEGATRQGEIVAALRADGYVDSGLVALVNTIATSTSPRARAHAAERLGWRGDVEAVTALRTRAAHPKDDITSVIIALGRIGDPAAFAVIHSEAARKLLSRRRAGSEALRLIGDLDSLRTTSDAAFARLPVSVQAVAPGDDVDVLVAAVRALPRSEVGATCDALYDLGSAAAVACVRAVLLEVNFTEPGIWRFAKSILKRAMTRLDGDTAGPLLHAIEKRGRTAKGGVVATLKSGLDGESRPTRVFSQRTAHWLAKAAWRWLQRIARYRSARYAEVAAACLHPYVDSDDVVPRKQVPASGHCYLLMRIVFGGSARFAVDRRRAIVRMKGKARPTREEAFSALWDQPVAFASVRRLLQGHRLVVAFATRLIEAHPAIVDDASAAELVEMAREPGPLTARVLAVLQQRLRSRFDPALIIVLGASEQLRSLAVATLIETAHIWTRDVDVSVAFVLGPPMIREAATRLLLLALPQASSPLRAGVVARLLPMLDVDLKDDDGRFDAVVELVDVLADEFSAAVTVLDALRLLARNTAGAAVAAVVVGRHAGILDIFGVEVIMGLAAQPIAARRRVAIAAINVDATALRGRLGLLLELAEGEWDDVRAACVTVLDGLDPAGLDVEQLTAIIDSTWPVVQEVGKRLVSARLVSARLISARLAGGGELSELLPRLAQHPHRALRRFVIDLSTSLARPGYVGLLRLEPIIRAVLFDVRPDVSLRHDVVTLLILRGQQDEAQAELVIGICKDIARSRTQALRDDALSAIAIVSAAFPSTTAVLADDHIVVDHDAVAA